MSTKRIKDSILEFKNEVQELHPFLEHLWHHIPEIKQVQNTHGVHEMGADFLLSRDDTILKREITVGVVVKCGTIKQDHAEVRRQIEECNVPRLKNGGKEHAAISEIWVVANGNITNGAQRRIHKDFENSKIQFIDIDNLVSLVEAYLPNYLTELSAFQNKFISDVSLKIAAESSSTSLVTGGASEFYVRPTIEEKLLNVYEPQSSMKRFKFKSIDLWSIDNLPKMLVLQGDVGSGKSRLLRELASKMVSAEEISNSGKLPILISAKEFVSNYGGEVTKLVEGQISAFGLDQDQEFVVLIDGLDEIDMSAEELSNLVERVRKELTTIQNARAIITTRKNSSYQDELLTKSGARLAEIQPLSSKQIIQVLKHICTGMDISKRLTRDLQKSAIFASLPHTPIAVILLGELLRENSQELPANLAELYSQYTDLVLGRLEVKRGLLTLKEYQVAKSFLKRLADYTMTNSLTRIGRAECLSHLTKYVSDRNLEIDPSGLLQKLTTRGAVLYLDLSTDTIGFRHKSFAEFFMASRLVEDGNLEVSSKDLNPYWITVLFFVVGLKRDCPQLLKEIFLLKAEDESDRAMRYLNGGNILLAAYETPYEDITESLKLLVDDVSEWYLEIIGGNSISKLSSLPRMHLLSVFRTIVSECYGYPHFASAFESLFLNSLSSEDSREKKAITLFLSRIAYLSADGKGDFDEIIEEMGIDLPLELQIAIDIDAKKLDVLTDAVRRHRKKLRQLAKQSPKLRHDIEVLFDRPIRDLS